ncbi:ABC transporter ATP-binding protein [Curtobacterium oceanosedimentum]|uniref:ABC transporter ATP-binding protein n=1 Tax=Curtobacterium oceanosedimentum TaxID=465820 RepID=A0A147DTA1_9MICO|nr:ATP-binding cassette domain-containing protein [Curtobacterium oceanosedimentum]KTR53551.1 ABC transporter ATP-binding protein [Curtobacterium oceanosedimentum]
MNLAEFNGFSKTYGSKQVVEDLTFAVPEGRVVGLLGKNGAGKSTALRGLLGLVRPTSGRALVQGQPFSSLSIPARVVGYSVDGVQSLQHARVADDLSTWANLVGASRARVEELLDLVGMTEHRRTRVQKLSTGQKQRHALAIALLAQPRLLILDEPTNGLDPQGIRWLRELIRHYAGQGNSVLISSHMLAEVEHTVDDVVILDRTVRYSGSLADLTGNGASLEERFFDLVPTPVAAGAGR